MSKDYRTAKDVINKMKKFYEINGSLNFSKLVKERFVKIERHHVTKEIINLTTTISLDQANNKVALFG